MNKKPKYCHIENEDQRITQVRNPDKEMVDRILSQLGELRKHGLVLNTEYGEVALVDYKTMFDKDHKPVFHFKIKSEEGIFLYLKTDHPKSDFLYDRACIWCRIKGYEMRDASQEAIKMMKLSHTAPKKEGIHPEMEYLKERKVF